MKKMKLKLVPVLMVAVLSILLFSCVPQSKLKYIQDPEGEKPKNVFDNAMAEYRIQPGDYLYIRIYTMDKEANQIYSEMSGSGMYGNSNELSVFLNSYLVSDSGYINFPMLGRLKAAGSFVADIESQIHDLLLNEVKDPGVVVRLVNFKITVLGEVKVPGTFTVNQNRISVFQAVSMAGDLTTYANRGEVRLLRKTGDKTQIITLDLTKKDVIASDYYYLRPGDIVYVEPLKSKQFAFETFPYALVLSGLSTIMALLTFIKI